MSIAKFGIAKFGIAKPALTLPAAALADAAQRLNTAEKTRVQIRQLSLDWPQMTLADSYAIQHAWMALKAAEGRVVKGHKIGLTSKAMQMAVKINEPDYGVLLDDMFVPEGGTVAFDQLIQPRVEMELAFVLKRALPGVGCTIYDVLNATDFVVPAIEILDARIERVDPQTGATRTVRDTIADNAANCGIVTGGRPVRPLDVDLRWVAGLLYRNGEIEETGVSAGVLNHPAQGIAWLANRLAPHGVTLEAGHVVLAGSFIRPVDIRKGDTIHADLGPLGSVTCHFA
ncbi:2-oxo-hept-4-ene-1,7-dioate hydratase [Xanthobacter sp. NM-25]|uniref:2-oxo-hept-4-ene-1,7-dioate hydratase n=1 Tax=unclassified Xanthobacter TaxID=2623496 RepID=UPI003FD3E2FC